MYFPPEWQNINYQVYVAESQILMAGKGLFAGRNFTKNTMIAPYFSTFSTYHSAVRRHGSEKQLTLRERLVECKYLCQSSDNIKVCPFIIDGDINCAAAFANDAKDSPFEVNVKLVEALSDDEYRDTWLHDVINYPEKALRDPRLIPIAAHIDIVTSHLCAHFLKCASRLSTHKTLKKMRFNFIDQKNHV